MSTKQHIVQRLRQLNRLLCITIIAVNLILCAQLFIPFLIHLYDDTQPIAAAYTTKVTQFQTSQQSNTSVNIYNIPQSIVTTADTVTLPLDQNRLIIDKINVNALVHDSDNLNLGVVRRQNSSTPDKGGNTVLVAHRNTVFDTANTFYLLDKMAIGDMFTVVWNGQEYSYQVDTIKVVTPDDIALEDPTGAPRLTLYTCTPFWIATHRLAVIARPIPL